MSRCRGRLHFEARFSRMSDAGARGGTRGGRDQFKWSDVKESADREYYLGHSVKATTGRWCKGRDVFWYAKARDDEDGGASAREELLRVKAREEDAMREALGLPPARASTSGREDGGDARSRSSRRDAKAKKRRRDRRDASDSDARESSDADSDSSSSSSSESRRRRRRRRKKEKRRERRERDGEDEEDARRRRRRRRRSRSRDTDRDRDRDRSCHR